MKRKLICAALSGAIVGSLVTGFTVSNYWKQQIPLITDMMEKYVVEFDSKVGQVFSDVIEMEMKSREEQVPDEV